MTTFDFENAPLDKNGDIDFAMGGMLPQIFGGINLHGLLTEIKKQQGAEAQPTNQLIANNAALTLGLPRPVDIIVARSLKDISPHHASCIQSKKNSMIGLGFVSEGDAVKGSKDDPGTSTEDAEKKIHSLLTGESFVESKVDKFLDPLTLFGFYYELSRAVEDFLDAGTGYLEVVRNAGGFIVGINWMPYEDLSVVIVRDEDGKGRLLYRCRTSIAGIVGGGIRFCSMFGKVNRDWVYDKYYINTPSIQPEHVSEIIAFKSPSNMSRWYGYPDWLSASSFITLLALSLQYKSDFYTNRGVLAFILSIAGQVNGEEWKKIKKDIEGSVGGGLNWRQLVINVGKDTKVDLHKLASTDKTELQFAKDTEVLAQSIVSAHQTPTVIANILIPGKLGATNEMVQALIMYQLLNIGPKQNIIQMVLSGTLGKSVADGGIKELDAEDFRLRKITSQFNIEGLDTVGRMREEAATATESNGTKRDVSAGTKD